MMTIKHANTKTKTLTKTNSKCFKGSMYVTFLKGTEFKDLKFYIGFHLETTMTHTKTKKNTKTECLKNPRYAIFSKSGGFNIFQG